MALTDNHRRVTVRCGGTTYTGMVYWATDSNGHPSVVIALPMATMAEQEALAKRAHPEATAGDLMDHVVDRIGRLGADVLPMADEAIRMARRN